MNFAGAETLAQKKWLRAGQILLPVDFAAAIPAIISGGIAERAKFHPQSIATFLLVLVYPFLKAYCLEPPLWGLAEGHVGRRIP